MSPFTSEIQQIMHAQIPQEQSLKQVSEKLVAFQQTYCYQCGICLEIGYYSTKIDTTFDQTKFFQKIYSKLLLGVFLTPICYKRSWSDNNVNSRASKRLCNAENKKFANPKNSNKYVVSFTQKVFRETVLLTIKS